MRAGPCRPNKVRFTAPTISDTKLIFQPAQQCRRHIPHPKGQSIIAPYLAEEGMRHIVEIVSHMRSVGKLHCDNDPAQWRAPTGAWNVDMIIVGVLREAGDARTHIGEPAELGKNRTLRFSELPQRPEFPVFQLAALPPNVIAGQVDVLPAQWRKVLQ